MAADSRFGTILTSLRQLAAPGGGAASDGRLLDDFVRHGNQDAFTTLVQRHAGMVLGVGRRVLGNADDVEDIFQATFLVLARNAPTIRKQESVASWLHGVAHRLALKSRTQLARLRAREARAEPRNDTTSDPDLAWRELQAVLDEEVERLPEKLRRPLVLCYFEDLSHDEAAKALGWPLGTLKTRVAKAKEALRQGLVRRGMTLSAAALATALTAQGTIAAPAALVRGAVQAASLLIQGKTLAGVVSARVLALLDGAAVLSAKTPLAVCASAALGGIFLMTLLGQPNQAGVPAEADDRAVAGRRAPIPQGVPTVRATAPAADPGDDPKDIAALPECHRKMLGAWHLAASETDGQRDAAPAKVEVRFTKDVALWNQPDGPKRLTYKVDPSVWPKAIDFVDAGGAIIRGIYDHKGAYLWLCLGEPGGARPMAFRSAAKTPQQVLLLARTPPAVEQADGLRATLTAAPVITADQPECVVQLVVQNVSARPLQVCRWIGNREERAGADYDLRLHVVTKGDADAVRLATTVLQPGDTTYWDVATIPNAAFRDREEITVAAGYTVPDADFAAKHGFWTGSVEARPLIIRVQRPPAPKIVARPLVLTEALRLDLGKTRPSDLAISADGKWLAAGADVSGVVSVWNLTTGRRAVEHRTSWLRIAAVALSADGRRVAAVGGGGYVNNGLIVWDTFTGRRILEQTKSPEFGRAAFSQDGNTLAIRAGGTVELWRLSTGALGRWFPVSEDQPAAVSADGSALVHFEDKRGLVDAASKEPWAAVASSLTWLGSTHIAPDGQSHAVMVNDWFPLPERPWAEKRRSLQRRTAGKPVPDWLVAMGSGRADHVVFSPDGRWIAKEEVSVVDGRADATLTLHDATTGKTLLTQSTSDDRFAGFVPNPTRLLTAHGGGVRVWNITEVDAPPPVPRPSAYGYGLPQGRYVAPAPPAGQPK